MFAPHEGGTELDSLTLHLSSLLFDVRDIKVREVVGLHVNISWISFGDAHHMFQSNISSLEEADWGLITPHSVCVVNILAAANINWISRRQGCLSARQPNTGMNNSNEWHDYIVIIWRKVLCWKARTSLSGIAVNISTGKQTSPERT